MTPKCAIELSAKASGSSYSCFSKTLIIKHWAFDPDCQHSLIIIFSLLSFLSVLTDSSPGPYDKNKNVWKNATFAMKWKILPDFQKELGYCTNFPSCQLLNLPVWTEAEVFSPLCQLWKILELIFNKKRKICPALKGVTGNSQNNLFILLFHLGTRLKDSPGLKL